MKKLTTILVSALVLVAFVLTAAPEVAAQRTDQQGEFFRAEVVEILEEGDQGFSGFSQPFQRVRVMILNGRQQGQEVEIEHGILFPISENQRVSVGEKVVLTTTQGEEGEIFVITDKFRIESVGILLVALLAAIFLIVGKRGVLAAATFAIGSALFVRFGMAQIQSGANAVVVNLISTLVFAAVYIAIVKTRDRAALANFVIIGSVVTIIAALNVFLTNALSVSGFGTQEALLLQTGLIDSALISGVFIGGVMFAIVGLLVDYGEYQLNTKRKDKGGEKFVNLLGISLFLLVGSSLSLLMFVVLNQSVPLWVSLNSELVTKEFIRIFSVVAALLLVPKLSRLEFFRL